MISIGKRPHPSEKAWLHPARVMPARGAGRTVPVMSIDGPGVESGWSGLFWEAFRRSRNAMVLLDDQRRHVDVNSAYLELLGYRRSALIGRPFYEIVIGGPLLSTREWEALLRRDQFTGVADLLGANARKVRLEFAGHPEIVTGRRLVLVVALKARPGASGHTERTGAGHEPTPLSGRELEVIQLIAFGLSGPEIADELHIAHNTVRTHVRNAMEKLDAQSRAHLVAIALAEALYWRRD